MPVPDSVLDLCERFRRNVDAYRSGRYNETQLRREFLDPLFKALGWDIDNKAGYAELYKDVVHEDAIKIGGTTKAPDYSFRVGGTRKFFLEAKKPSVNIKGDPHPAFQLRRYAWSAKLPLSILSDFEELAVYDCRIKPKKGDRASTARVLYFTFEEYPDRWDEIESLFSKEAVLRGSFDRYADSAKAKRGTAEVDDAFLSEIEGWRERLAKNFALRNPDLTERDLNFVVQRTIDRLIFLRIAEDRGIEPYGELREGTKGKGVYERLVERFKLADARYNSGLFHFRQEPGRDGMPDLLTPAVRLDDKPLRDIIRSLYYPESPYEFSVLPADLLGQVYEQFLGSTIVLTRSKQAEVVQKPEVKKAGGVYYTPSYVVDYIVSETVEAKLEGSTPDRAATLKVVDPACGSGTFLIGAYDALLRWHLRYYTEDDPGSWARRRPARVYKGQDGDWRLTTDEKKRILLNSIHGVDLDEQAVEVTKLSLLLKVLEGESDETLRQFSLFEERVLPDLSENIKAGNALVGPDYYDEHPEALEDMEAARALSAFDWEREFPDVFGRKRPGFDVCIGNPPYVRQESLKAIKPYLQAKYAAYHGGADLFVFFAERSLDLLRNRGLYSVIVSASLLYSDYGVAIRSLLAEQATLRKAVDFGGLPVFKHAKDTYTVIPILEKGRKSADTVEIVQVPSLVPPDLSILTEGLWHDVPADRFSTSKSEKWSLRPDAEVAAFRSMVESGRPLDECVGGFYYGIKTGLNAAFVVDGSKRDELVEKSESSEDLLRPFVGGTEVRRYALNRKGRYLIAVPNGWTRSAMPAGESDPWAWFSASYPAIAAHLKPYEEKARARQDQGEFWWELRACTYYHVLEGSKIIYPDIAKGPRFYLDSSGVYGTNTTYMLETADPYLLGLLNSRLAWFCIGHLSIPFGVRDGRFRYRLFSQYMEKLPVVDPGEGDSRRASLAGLAEQLQDAHRQLQEVRTASDKTLLSRRIQTLDSQANRLVYDLYDLTSEEIEAVEAAGNC